METWQQCVEEICDSRKGDCKSSRRRKIVFAGKKWNWKFFRFFSRETDGGKPNGAPADYVIHVKLVFLCFCAILVDRLAWRRRNRVWLAKRSKCLAITTRLAVNWRDVSPARQVFLANSWASDLIEDLEAFRGFPCHSTRDSENDWSTLRECMLMSQQIEMRCARLLWLWTQCTMESSYCWNHLHNWWVAARFLCECEASIVGVQAAGFHEASQKRIQVIHSSERFLCNY